MKINKNFYWITISIHFLVSLIGKYHKAVHVLFGNASYWKNLMYNMLHTSVANSTLSWDLKMLRIYYRKVNSVWVCLPMTFLFINKLRVLIGPIFEIIELLAPYQALNHVIAFATKSLPKNSIVDTGIHFNTNSPLYNPEKDHMIILTSYCHLKTHCKLRSNCIDTELIYILAFALVVVYKDKIPFSSHLLTWAISQIIWLLLGKCKISS